jgi:hypothetical protein
MPLTFEPIRLGRQDAYLKYLDVCPQKASDYSFVNLWSWREAYGLEWAWSAELVYIRQTYPHEVFWAPVGAWDRIDWRSEANGMLRTGVSYTRVPEMLARLWREAFQATISTEESRDHWDYLYSRSELQILPGNRFHKKKNLVNQFQKKYAFEYMPLAGPVIDLASGMQDRWCTWRDCEIHEALDAENKAIATVLENWHELKRLTGGALMVEENIVAYTVAEYLTEHTVLIHFEKGDPAYKGVYQAINRMFLEQAADSFQFVNREQDLGDAGLRKAKLSYHPVDFVKKYSVTFLNSLGD